MILEFGIIIDQERQQPFTYNSQDAATPVGGLSEVHIYTLLGWSKLPISCDSSGGYCEKNSLNF